MSDGGPPKSTDVEGLLEPLEHWLRETIDEPERGAEVATTYAARLREAAGTLPPGRARTQVDLIADLILTLGASVATTERRAIRFGFDLHDGAIQHVVLTGFELQTLRSELERLPEGQGGRALEFVSTVHSRLLAVETDLRELAHALETPSLANEQLEEAVRNEISTVVRETGIEVLVEIDGDFDRTSASQRIAVLRVLQGALANVRQHARARHVSVTLEATEDRIDFALEDDGQGFVVEQTLDEAAQRGRLGLVAMSERIRLLGGEFDLDSRPGGPTRVSVSLKRLPTAPQA